MTNHMTTGFGIPETNLWAPFAVLKTAAGEYPDWAPTLITSNTQIVGSDNSETQIMGFGPADLSLTIDFENRTSFRKFRTLWGRELTLVLLAEFTQHEGDIKTIAGVDFEYYDKTLLLGISNVAHLVGGYVECVATFRRAATGLGVYT